MFDTPTKVDMSMYFVSWKIGAYFVFGFHHLLLNTDAPSVTLTICSIIAVNMNATDDLPDSNEVIVIVVVVVVNQKHSSTAAFFFFFSFSLFHILK